MSVIKPEAYVNDTAVVHESARIGRGTKVWHFAVVHEGAVIGEDCVIGQGCYVGPGVRIGNGVRIQNHVNVFAGVTIEDDVFLGPCVVFTNCKNPRAYTRGRIDKTHVHKGATIGANATIVCGTSLFRYCFVGAGSVVTKDVEAYGIVWGVPARLTGYAEGRVRP